MRPRFTMKDLKPHELARTRELGAACRAKGCRCVRGCWQAWGRYWIGKAEVCTHPNWMEADAAAAK